ncbi:hypothetical protein [Glycomyces sp. NRRL B-16210]|uniref:hypothetical protein n=1 Tax=Glycomyces sp. NRRL B-16210 TaxID=1463821 RepID=UPI0018CC4E36|nr:hypothetical protein [Glycomyces sp. NRRL B-16210]
MSGTRQREAVTEPPRAVRGPGGGAPVLPRRILSHRLELVRARPSGQFACLTYKVQ